MTSRTRRAPAWRTVALAGAPIALLLAGCAMPLSTGYDLAPGTTRAEVLARLGPPTNTWALAHGERWLYSLQPMGQQAWVVDLDGQGRVSTVHQALQPATFARIGEGAWTRAQVERELGPPARVERVASWPGDILTYRWTDGSDMFFWVYLDAQQRVQRTQTGMEFVNAAERD